MQRSSQVEQAAKDVAFQARPSPVTRSLDREDTERTLTDGGLQLPPQLAEPESEGSQESRAMPTPLQGGNSWHREGTNLRMLQRGTLWHPSSPPPRKFGHCRQHGHAVQSAQESRCQQCQAERTGRNTA